MSPDVLIVAKLAVMSKESGDAFFPAPAYDRSGRRKPCDNGQLRLLPATKILWPALDLAVQNLFDPRDVQVFGPRRP